jgi:acrylyl-CoA reductase (NADPH)
MASAWTVTRGDGGDADVRYGEVPDDQLGDGDVLVDVSWSSLNYKDGLALRGDAGVARVSPLIPGIDLVGTVAESADARWSPGDDVLVTGWGHGETRHGGYATRARVPADHLTALPVGLTPRRAAAIGTAGFTAMLAVMALEDAVPADALRARPVLVTGANGGVGSVAIALLAAAGLQPVAATGRTAEAEYLARLGAIDVVDRSEFADASRPLQKERWSAAVDSLGGAPLVNVLAQTAYGGAVAVCGLAAGPELPATVLPLILRGVSLLGVNSVLCPAPRREAAWQRLARDLVPELLDGLTREIGIADVVDEGRRILDGRVQGRTVVRIG